MRVEIRELPTGLGYRSSSLGQPPRSIDPLLDVADEREAGPTLRRLRKEATLSVGEVQRPNNWSVTSIPCSAVGAGRRPRELVLR